MTGVQDDLAWWSARLRRLIPHLFEPEVVRMAAGLLGLLLLLSWLHRHFMRLWRERGAMPEIAAQPDPYRHAVHNIVASRAATAPRSAALELVDDLPTGWTPEVLRRLDAPALELLATRLWQLRGMRAQGESRGVILLRHPTQVDRLHGVALCSRGDDSGGLAAARELFGLMRERGCDYGAVMSAGDFGIEARDFVRGKHIELKGRATLMAEIEALSELQRATLLSEVLRKPRAA